MKMKEKIKKALQLTLTRGVEQTIKKAVPEVKRVEAV
jgi:Fe-S cluster biogenesis protein NfuA